MKKICVAPSILSADFSKLGEEIKLVESLGAEYLHFDVMDGHFVPNISFGVPVFKSISSIHLMTNDVHLMISEPKKYIPKFAEAGADIITFHFEACHSEEEVFELIDMIHDLGIRAGISIKPKTPVDVLAPFLESLDLILIMSVEPGFGGQEFMPEALDKISYLREAIDSENYNCLIEVDGGINDKTGRLCIGAGVDILVAGSYLFGKEDIKERMESLR